MKKTFKKWAPTKERMQQGWLYRWFGNRLNHPSLWAFNRRSVVLAVSFGVFSAFMPIPAQMPLAAVLAYICRVNVPIAIASVWVSNPFTTIPMFYAAYRVGTLSYTLAGSEPEHILGIVDIGYLLGCIFHPMSCHVDAGFTDVIGPFLVGLILTGIIASIATYYILNYIWLRQSKSAWFQRKMKRGIAAAKQKLHKDEADKE
jgi:uncharacterized protein (DUF2062 family)